MKMILIQFVLNAVLLYGLAFLCGNRIRFGGIASVLSVAIFLVPINVFIVDLNTAVGIPHKVLYVFLSSVVCNGLMLYALSHIIPRFAVENLRVALGFAAIMGAVALFLHFFLADQLRALL